MNRAITYIAAVVLAALMGSPAKPRLARHYSILRAAKKRLPAKGPLRAPLAEMALQGLVTFSNDGRSGLTLLGNLMCELNTV